MEPGTRPSSPEKQQWQAVDLSFEDANWSTTSDMKNIKSKQQYEGTFTDVIQNMDAFTSRLKEYGSGAEEEKFDFRFYLALSWHKEINPSWKRFKVKYDIDWRLDEDWKETLIKCFGIIETAYPGIQIWSQICYSSTSLTCVSNNAYICNYFDLINFNITLSHVMEQEVFNIYPHYLCFHHHTSLCFPPIKISK